jgi:hypothetical protein
MYKNEKEEKMTLVKCLYSYLVCVLILLSLFPSNVICGDTEEKYKCDDALVEAANKKAEELGHPCTLIYKEKEEGAIQMFGVVRFNKNGRYYAEDDMIVNVGEFSIPVDDFNLLKGEYAVVKGNKFVKQAGKITFD